MCDNCKNYERKILEAQRQGNAEKARVFQHLLEHMPCKQVPEPRQQRRKAQPIFELIGGLN